MTDDTSPDWENAALLTIDVQKTLVMAEEYIKLAVQTAKITHQNFHQQRELNYEF